ncbi:DUF177 domain-containing protein [Cohnella sp. AR92]|uniref:YceD family protein n=1 Tax=Cohnella sp. AR92 TaxID=648716 RepID=UPI00131561B2|nr:DUF177 domain-containing protein [Cohnella sp. AR92]
MLLNVQDLAARKQPVALKETVDVTEAYRNVRDVKPLGPLTAELTAVYADGLIDVSGTIDCKLQFQCSRCLDPIEKDWHIPFQATFKVVAKEQLDQDEPEDEDILRIKDEPLELLPYIEEELMLSMPLAPICKDDCKGLCPDCGQNRNEQECGCHREKIDPRFDALRDWFGSK